MVKPNEVAASAAAFRWKGFAVNSTARGDMREGVGGVSSMICAEGGMWKPGEISRWKGVAENSNCRGDIKSGGLS